VSASQSDTSVTVVDTLKDLPVGAIVSFYGRERHFVQDVDDTSGQITLSTDDGLVSGYAESTKLHLHSVPIETENTVSAGDTSIDVSSDYIIVIGDQIEELIDADNPSTSIAHKVTDVTVTTEGDSAPFEYTLTLKTGVVSADPSLQLRAFPAYKSLVLPLPTQASTLNDLPVGPFLWDITEGRITDGVDDPSVTLAVRTVSSAYVELDPFAAVEKNTPHYRCPIDASTFMLWNMHVGKMTVKEGRPVLIPNDNGDALLYKIVVPEVPADTGWYTRIIATAPCTLRIGFHVSTPSYTPATTSDHEWIPSIRMLYQTITLSTGSNFVLIKSPGFKTGRIEIGLFTETPEDTEVSFTGWSPSNGRSCWAQYTLVAAVSGGYTWGSYGMCIKPLFMNADHLRSKTAPRLDGGEIIF